MALAAEIAERTGDLEDAMTQLDDARNDLSGLEAAYAAEVGDHEHARAELNAARAEIVRLEQLLSERVICATRR